VAELLADDPDIHALGAELGGVGVPQPVGVHALGAFIRGSSSSSCSAISASLR
jgi:hypothetical protein